MREIMLPTVRGLMADGIHYRGFLYAGLMIDDAGRPFVIEFNCRLGDPETQPILFRLRTDLADVCLSCFDGTLGTKPIDWDSRATVGVVMASRGYPDAYDKGKPISGLDRATGSDVKVFHAGTQARGRPRRDRRRPRAVRRWDAATAYAPPARQPTQASARSPGTAGSTARTSAIAPSSAKKPADGNCSFAAFRRHRREQRPGTP